MRKLIRFARPGYDSPTFVNADLVTHITHYGSGSTRIHFDHENSVIVTGLVDEIANQLSR